MILCAYHSNLYFDAFTGHVAEMKAKGFDTILFAITETDILFNLEIFHEFKQYAESQGLQTWATFWGYSAGEAICKECNVKKWLQAVKSIGFTDIMIDEPKDVDSIHLFSKYHDFNFHLCLTDDVFHSMFDDQIREMPVKSLGVSCYHLGHRDWMKVVLRTFDIATRLHVLRPDDNFVFVQGFDIPEGMEDLPSIVKDICEVERITNFGFWSFRATEATSSKRPINHKAIWVSVKF